MIRPISSLGDLHRKALVDPSYLRLAFVAAENLGGAPMNTLDQAMRWLRINAQETTEDGVVDEINHCRDCL